MSTEFGIDQERFDETLKAVYVRRNEIQSRLCAGCYYNAPSQKDHSCLHASEEELQELAFEALYEINVERDLGFALYKLLHEYIGTPNDNDDEEDGASGPE